MRCGSQPLMNELDILSKIQTAIASGMQGPSEHAPQKTLDNVVTILPSLLNAERCSLFIRDLNQERIWLQCGTGRIDRELDLPMRGSISGEVILTHRSQIINDLSGHIGTHTDVEALANGQTRNMICVPIRNSTDQKVRGALQILNKLDHTPFNETDCRLLEKVAELIKPMVGSIYKGQSLYTTQTLKIPPQLILAPHKKKQLALLFAALVMSGMVAFLLAQE